MTSLAVERRRPVAGVPLLLAFFAAAVAVRSVLTGPPGAGAPLWPAVVFGVLLALGALAVGTPTRVSARVVAVGAVATVALVVPALVFASVRASLPLSSFPVWMAATALVAPAEEAFLRGAVYDAVARRWSADVAIGVAALAFGLMHVPLYGWHALPLDTAVGAVLGVARLASGTWVAPAIAHTAADAVGWFML
ncbi:MAG: Type prenyl endopeptidase Rce1-like [Frankiaceae bacterium]|jgi:membrane protease YdiL (CAAX protease family)|nr:Type prenyl endopeptidase Rce1-like [Frankiaceae bacterium]